LWWLTGKLSPERLLTTSHPGKHRTGTSRPQLAHSTDSLSKTHPQSRVHTLMLYTLLQATLCLGYVSHLTGTRLVCLLLSTKTLLSDAPNGIGQLLTTCSLCAEFLPGNLPSQVH